MNEAEEGTSRLRRSGAPGPPVWWTVVVVLVGALSGLTVVTWAWSDRASAADDAFVIWSFLAIALTTTSALVAETGRRRLRDIAGLRAVTGRSVWSRTGALLTLVAAVTSVPLLIDASAATARGAVLCYVAVLGSATVIASFTAIRLAATGEPSGRRGLGSRAGDYLELRWLGAGLLPPLGALVALSTLALGATRLSIAAPDEPAAFAGTVVVFGAVGTTLVGLAYSLPYVALRSEARVLVRQLAPIPDSGPEAVRDALGDRHALESRLGLNSTLLGDLQTGVPVFAPLLAATGALFLTGRG